VCRRTCEFREGGAAPARPAGRRGRLRAGQSGASCAQFRRQAGNAEVACCRRGGRGGRARGRGAARLSAGRAVRAGTAHLSSGSENELLETWIIMAFCDQGTLETAIRQNRFNGDLVPPPPAHPSPTPDPARLPLCFHP